jgi:membrane associated rhomboid family serine protease
MLPLRDNIPHRRLPWVNYALITACVLVFLQQLQDPHHKLLIDQLAFRPSFLLAHNGAHAAPDRLLFRALATMFMHGSWLHLISNMWFLWIFGDNVEDRMGSLRYLAFYLVCGLAATAAHAGMTIFGASVTNAKALAVPMVGASGAIAGVLAAYLRLFPKARILSLVPFIFFFIVEIPAVVFILFWFGLQVMYGLAILGQGVASGVAFWAHIGGFLTGLMLTGVFAGVPPKPQPPRVLEMHME